MFCQLPKCKIAAASIIGSSVMCGVSLSSRFKVRYYYVDSTIKRHVKYESSLPVFIVGTLAIPIIILTSPMIFADTLCNTCICDKIIDNIQEKYNLTLGRYHQYGNSSKGQYYANSITILEINKRLI